MVDFKLVRRNLTAHPIRSLLTIGSMAVAVFLLCFLRAAAEAVEAGVNDAAVDRLMVQSKVSLFVQLPLSYREKIAAVDGVEKITAFQWFGGQQGDGSQFFSQFGVTPDDFIDAYPEIKLRAGSFEPFKTQLNACLVGSTLALARDIEVGQTFPVVSPIFQRSDGRAWEFEVAGIYHSDSAAIDNNTLFFNYEFLEKGLEGGAAAGEIGVGVYVLRTAPENRLTVQSRVDELFENGPQVVQTTTEAEFQRQFVGMFGNIPFFLNSIGAAVLFAIVIAVVNTMLMAARERTRDVGILKALGFRDSSVTSLIVWESVLLCVVGGGLGVALSGGAQLGLAPFLATFFPGFEIGTQTVILGFIGSVIIGLIAALMPGMQFKRLRPVEALRSEA